MKDNLDLLMRACEKAGYGVSYGRFVANTTPAQRAMMLAEERCLEQEREVRRLEKGRHGLAPGNSAGSGDL